MQDVAIVLTCHEAFIAFALLMAAAIVHSCTPAISVEGTTTTHLLLANVAALTDAATSAPAYSTLLPVPDAGRA